MDLHKSSGTDDHHRRHRHRHHRQRPTSCRGLWSFLDTHDTCQTTITSIVVFTLPEAAARNRGHFIVWCLLRFLKILAFKVTSIMLQLLFQSITTFVVWSGPTWSSFVCWLQIIDSRFLRFSVFFPFYFSSFSTQIFSQVLKTLVREIFQNVSRKKKLSRQPPYPRRSGKRLTEEKKI